ncbi:uncharacterized protein LOC115770035 isoform X1 [Drosophila novamexicana]|uniref:uncharacterized protein LOC115770035 isoform X1 n=1 Tax=Drosophila novamexicana TaxID=47314 RepID=UPI0011E5D5F8|nr:uncharacterized protein LOC115770035 isoform X1 [Drosophila novamexicana]
MHANQKKKARARNRPRNKCNRSGETEQAKILDVPESVPVSSDLEQVEPQPEPPKVEPNTSAIYLIQKILRKKLLAKKSPSVATSPANAAPAKVPAPPPKLANGNQSDEVSELLKCIGNKLQKGSAELPTGAVFSQLGKMFSTAPLSDSESSDEEAEYVEYIYKPRQYFMASLCNHCKVDLCGRQPMPCRGCGLVYYCSVLHMRDDQEHRQLCYGLRQLVERNGHDTFYKCGDFTAEQFRSYRIVCIRQLEQAINRSLTATEQEVLLFPFICGHVQCREHRLKKLAACGRCSEAAFCRDKPDHLGAGHAEWCGAFRLFKVFVMFQAKFGRLEPPLPDKVLRDAPLASTNTRQILKKLSFDVTDACEFAALTQISTGPLTAFLALKLCGRLKAKELTIHLVGAEMEFEVDVFQKWEIFLLHILPAVATLNVVFVGPELNTKNISFDQLSKIRCCRLCRKAQRTVKYHFENQLYHNYCSAADFQKPDLACFFNSGLYRATGYALEDTWPETIRATLNLKCPVVVTSYTKYEAPLDLSHFLNQSNRQLSVVLPPTTNPFGSEKPERNFISDDDAPFMFKNFQCFVIE